MSEDLTPECHICGNRTHRWVDGLPTCVPCDQALYPEDWQ